MEKLHPQTGPVTHGGTSEKLIVPASAAKISTRSSTTCFEEYSPATVQARSLVEDAALARWFVWRKQRTYNAVESALYSAQPAARSRKCRPAMKPSSISSTASRLTHLKRFTASSISRKACRPNITPSPIAKTTAAKEATPSNTGTTLPPGAKSPATSKSSEPVMPFPAEPHVEGGFRFVKNAVCSPFAFPTQLLDGQAIFLYNRPNRPL